MIMVQKYKNLFFIPLFVKKNKERAEFFKFSPSFIAK